MSTAKFNTWLNPDGTENYKARAWVNFNGTGTVAIRGSGNVSSITDRGTGQYTINFTTAMPDANYAPAGMGATGGSGSVPLVNAGTNTTTQCYVATQSTSYIDREEISVAIFR